MNVSIHYRVDVTNCDREPIHIPGAIQPHGVLLALREPELRIMQISANAADHLGAPATELLGQSVLSLLDAPSRTTLAPALSMTHIEDVNPLLLSVADRRFDGILHRHQGVLILELEPEAASIDRVRAHHPLRQAVALLQSAATTADLYRTAVEQVQRLTGYERVMIYRFDEEGHGTVEAEIKDEALDAYLGLRYPASDIPQQARELYRRNWIRSIPDARYTPAPLVPAQRPDTGAPLDLSLSGLRSVSPVHIEYLANMGVRASLSVSLIVRDRLWGLISCANHSGPRRLPFAVRADCELLGRLLSLLIAAFDDREFALRRERRRPTLEKLSDTMRAGDDVLVALLALPDELLRLFGVDGAAVVGDGVRTIGRAPSEAAIATLSEWLETKHEGMVYATDSLAKDMPAMRAVKDVASGIISFALPGTPPRRFIGFRPEIVQTVKWGGDPRKPLADEPGPALHPRRSFALWREEVRLRSEPWRASDYEAADDLRRRAVEIDLGKQVQRERTAVRVRDELVAVVSHDLRNPLGVIQMQAALLRASAEQGGVVPAPRLNESVDRVERSVRRMNSLIHDLLDLAKIEAGRFELDRQPEPVHELVAETVSLMRPLAEAKDIALHQDVEPNALVHANRERVFQVLSNLVGNAIKFTPAGGRVALRTAIEKDTVLFAVMDSGPGIDAALLPKLFERYWQATKVGPDGAGLGLYIAKGIVEAHGGSIWAERSHEGGACFKFTLPIAGNG